MAAAELKKKRASNLAVVTRECNKQARKKDEDPSTFDIPQLQDRIERMFQKQKEFKELQTRIFECGDKSVDEDEEQSAIEVFEDIINQTVSTIRRLISLKQVHMSIRRLDSELNALSKAKDEMPERNHATNISRNGTSFDELSILLDNSTISLDHPYHGDIIRLQERLSFLSTTETARPPTPSHEYSHSSSSERKSASIRLPKFNLPTFHGDIMKWTAFWAQFSSAVDSVPELDQINKLTYLRDAIKDPSINPILFNGANNEWHYDEVVAHLKARYHKPKSIHANYSKQLTETSTIKNTQPDLISFADDLDHFILGLQAINQFDLESCMTSLAIQRLPRHLRELWQVKTQDNSTVAPIQKLIAFIRSHAETVGAGAVTPVSITISPEPKAEVKRECKPHQPMRHRAALHTTTSSTTPTFKYECPLSRETSLVSLLKVQGILHWPAYGVCEGKSSLPQLPGSRAQIR